MHEWSFLVNYSPSISKWALTRGCEVIGWPDAVAIGCGWRLFLTGPSLLLVWAAFSLRRRLFRNREKMKLDRFPLMRGRAASRALSFHRRFSTPEFCSVVGVTGYAGIFSRLLNYCTQPWYYTLSCVCRMHAGRYFGVRRLREVQPLSFA